jgi:hypothetical protein
VPKRTLIVEYTVKVESKGNTNFSFYYAQKGRFLPANLIPDLKASEGSLKILLALLRFATLSWLCYTYIE